MTPAERPQRFRFPPVNRVPDWARKLFTLDELRVFHHAIEDAMWCRMNWFEVKEGFLVVHLPTGDIAQCGLLNVATRCAAGRPPDYPALVEAHFSRCFADVLPSAGLPKGLPSFDEVRKALRIRLYSDAFLGDKKGHNVGREISPGLNAVVVIDYPHMAASLDRELLAELGGTEEEAFAAGTANCRDLKLSRAPMPISGTDAFMLTSDHHYVTSQIFHLERHLPAVHMLWALLSMPHRHNLRVCPVTGSSLAEAIPALHFVTCGLFQESSTEEGLALSPHLYWWHEGELTLVPVVGQPGQSHAVIVPPEFIERVLLSSTLTGKGARA